MLTARLFSGINDTLNKELYLASFPNSHRSRQKMNSEDPGKEANFYTYLVL